MSLRRQQKSNSIATQYINNMVNVNVDMRNNEDLYCTYNMTSLHLINCNIENSRSAKFHGNTTRDSIEVKGYQTDSAND